jgi:hypothetical protein
MIENDYFYQYPDYLPAFKCGDSRLCDILKSSDAISRNNASDTSTLKMKLQTIYI